MQLEGVPISSFWVWQSFVQSYLYLGAPWKTPFLSLDVKEVLIVVVRVDIRTLILVFVPFFCRDVVCFGRLHGDRKGLVHPSRKGRGFPFWLWEFRFHVRLWLHHRLVCLHKDNKPHWSIPLVWDHRELRTSDPWDRELCSWYILILFRDSISRKLNQNLLA